MEEEFVKALKSRNFDLVLSLLKVNENLIWSSRDECGNNCLHLAVLAQREDLVGLFLRRSEIITKEEKKEDILKQVNHDGKTPLDLSTDLGLKRISWTLMQCGRMKGNISQKNLFSSLPDFDHGNTFLHIYARSNYANEIKHFIDSCDNVHDYVDLALRANNNGDTAAMVAAKMANKESLAALLEPLINFSCFEKVSQFLHHRNNEGHPLLAYVALHPMNLTVIHGLLIEMENAAHNQSTYEVKNCLRNTLGSSVAAKFSLDLLKRLKHKTTLLDKIFGFVRIFTVTVLLRSFLMFLDLYTDAVLIRDYWNQWDKEENEGSAVVFPGLIANPRNPCKETKTVVNGDVIESTHVWATNNITLGCYPGVITGRNRFYLTTIIVILPFLLYFFELLRFRTFSIFLERCCPEDMTVCCDVVSKWIVRPMGNFLLWLFWPLHAFIKQAYFRFKFETAKSDNLKLKNKSASKSASLISSRAQLIEVCTEASLQPLFQFYLVFKDVVSLDLNSLRHGLTEAFDEHRRQMASVMVSLITLSLSYTMQYRQNKENSLSIIPTLTYFIMTSCFVISRILCLELFAYYLGPGYFRYFMGAVGCHALLMSVLHFIFSDSLSQCLRITGQSLTSWIRQLLLVLHNCALNGMANIYLHNELKIFVQKSKSRKRMRRNSTQISENFVYVSSDERQHTFVRQCVFDLVFLSENAAMLYLSQFTITQTSNFREIHFTISFIVTALFLCGMSLKFLFYIWLHPWAELIRPKSIIEWTSSCVVLSKIFHCEISKKGKCCRVIPRGNSIRKTSGRDKKYYYTKGHQTSELYEV